MQEKIIKLFNYIMNLTALTSGEKKIGIEWKKHNREMFHNTMSIFVRLINFS